MVNTSSIKLIPIQSMKCCIVSPFMSDEDILNNLDLFFENFKDIMSDDEIEQIKQQVLDEKNTRLNDPQFIIELNNVYSGDINTIYQIGNEKLRVLNEKAHTLPTKVREKMYSTVHLISTISMYYKNIMPYLNSKFDENELKNLKTLFESFGISDTFSELYDTLNKSNENDIGLLKNSLESLTTTNIPLISDLIHNIIINLKLSGSKAIKVSEILSKYQVVFDENYEQVVDEVSSELNLTPSEISILYNEVTKNPIWINDQINDKIIRTFYNLDCSQINELNLLTQEKLKSLVYTDENVNLVKNYFLDKCNDNLINEQLQQIDPKLLDSILKIIPTTTSTYKDIQKTSLFYKKVILNAINNYVYKNNSDIVDEILYNTEDKLLDSIKNDIITLTQVTNDIKNTITTQILPFIDTVISNKESTLAELDKESQETLLENSIEETLNNLKDPTLSEEDISSILDNTIEKSTNIPSDEILIDYYSQFNDKISDLQSKLESGEITQNEFNEEYSQLVQELNDKISKQQQALNTLTKLLNEILQNSENYPLSETLISQLKDKINQLNDVLQKSKEKSPETIGNTDITVDQAINSDQGLSVTKSIQIDDNDLQKLLDSDLIDSNDPVYVIPVDTSKQVVTDDDTLIIDLQDKKISADITSDTKVNDLPNIFPDTIIVINNYIVFSNKDSLVKPKLTTANNSLNIPSTPKLTVVKKKNITSITPSTKTIKQSAIQINNIDEKLLKDDTIEKTTIPVTIDGVTKNIEVTKYDTVGSFIDKLTEAFPNKVTTVGNSIIFSTNPDNITINNEDTDISIDTTPVNLPDKVITVDNAVNIGKTEIDQNQPLSTTNEPISGDVTVTINNTDIIIPISDAVTTGDMIDQISDYLSENPELGTNIFIDSDGNLVTASQTGTNSITITPPETADNVEPINQELSPVNVQTTTSNNEPILSTIPDNQLNNPINSITDQTVADSVSDILNNYNDKDTEDPVSLIKQTSEQQPINEVLIDTQVSYKENINDNISIPITDPITSITPLTSDIQGISSETTPTTNITTNSTLTAPIIPDTSFANVDVPGASLPVVSKPSVSDILPAANSNADNIDNIIVDIDDSNPDNISETISPNTASSNTNDSTKKKQSEISKLRALIKMILGEYKKVNNYKRMILKVQKNTKNGEYVNKGLRAATAYANHLSDSMSAWNRRKMASTSMNLGNAGNGLLALLQRIANSIGSFAQSLARIAGAGRSMPICHPPSKEQMKALAQQAVKRAVSSKLNALDDFIAAIKRMIKTIISMIRSIIAMLNKLIRRMINTIKAIIKQTIMSIVMALGQDACDLLVGLATIKGLIGKIIKLKSALSKLKLS